MSTPAAASASNPYANLSKILTEKFGPTVKKEQPKARSWKDFIWIRRDPKTGTVDVIDPRVDQFTRR